jgi:hypothetical protein
MENNELEMEKQKFELEKQKLELEKQKLDFEKSKFENKNSSSIKNENTEEHFINNISDDKTKSLNIISFIAAGVLAITPFLPWVESSASGFGFSFKSSANGFECGHGYYILIFAIAGIVLAYMKNKFVFIPGVLALVDGLTVVTGIGSHSSSFMGASSRAGFAIGPILVIISSLVLIASPFIKGLPKSSGGKSIDFKSIFIKYKYQLLVSLTALLILMPIWSDYRIYDFFEFVIALIFFSAAPILLLKYLKFEKTYRLFFALPIFYLVEFIGSLQNSGFGQQSQFFYNYNDSLRNATTWFNYVFYICVLSAFIIDIIGQKKKEILPASIDKYKFVFKPIVPLAALLIPFIAYFTYYATTRHQITDEEVKKFETTNSYFSGDWYFMNKDSSAIFKFQVYPVYSGQRYNTGDLAAKFEYRLFKPDEQFMGGQTLDTILIYDAKLELPLKFLGGTEISSLKDNLLNVKLKLSDGTFMIFNAINDKNVLVSIIESKTKNISNALNEEVNEAIEQTEEFKLISGGCSDDGCTLVFINGDGKEIISTQFPEKIIQFDTDGDSGAAVANAKYLNKKYLITYKLKNVHHEESNSDDIEMVIEEMKMIK